MVLIPHDEIWWVPFLEVRGRHSVCTNIERDALAGYRAATDGLKKVPAEVAGTILFLCTDNSNYITGENILVTGGHTMH